MLAGELNKPGQKNTKIDKYSSPGARCKKQKRGEREGDMEKGGRRHQRKKAGHKAGHEISKCESTSE